MEPMATRERDSTLRPSVLDRLTTRGGGGSTVERIRASVMADLEDLLNTRRTSAPAPDGFPELQRSLYHYGLADLTSRSADHSESPTRLARDIEEAIRLHEPRLTAVRVTVPELDAEVARRRLHFMIEATLEVDPVPEAVVFDTVLDVTRGSFNVGGSRHA